MNRVEAVERAAAAIAYQHPLELIAAAALDASGYPAALAEAIEILRAIGHRSSMTVNGEPVGCLLCGKRDCRTARFLAEHDETT